jgi:ubiquinone/menaquinone biosynthesis C-methylase UbiE
LIVPTRLTRQVKCGQVSTDSEKYQRIAPLYDLLELPFEYGRYRRLRRLVFDGLTGRILDAGVGTGRNVEFYPTGAKVIGIDVSPAMLARAERRLKLSSASAVELREMDITRLDFPAGAFDAAAATFLFCVLPDELQLPALRELRRVVRPGGTVRLLDYVRPRRFLRSTVAKLWEPWIAWAYGASFDRDTERYIPEAGLELVNARFVVDELVKLVAARVSG